ncbi:MAG TPA: hypothetical protein VK939_01925 [Longimicrobiales bacterium]|nr:hypothetical protein [Longimicrobiales bacterium]
MNPRALAARLERRRTLPHGSAERFTGYGALGVPLESGHLLAFRRFASSSIGPPFSSVWHRDPAGRWTFYVDVEPARACPRYFGPALHAVKSDEIEIEWIGSHGVAIHVVGAELNWSLRLAATPVSVTLGALIRFTPDPLWRAPGLPEAFGTAVGALMGAGALRLRGRAPAGQPYLVHPTRLWEVAASTATLGALDLGADTVTPESGQLGDFLVPRRGLFAAGTAIFGGR